MPFWGHCHAGSEGLSEKAVTFGGIFGQFLANFFLHKNRSHERGPKPAKHRPMFGGFLPSFGNATDCTIWEMGPACQRWRAVFGHFLVDFWEFFCTKTGPMKGVKVSFLGSLLCDGLEVWLVAVVISGQF